MPSASSPYPPRMRLNFFFHPSLHLETGIQTLLSPFPSNSRVIEMHLVSNHGFKVVVAADVGQ